MIKRYKNNVYIEKSEKIKLNYKNRRTINKEKKIILKCTFENSIFKPIVIFENSKFKPIVISQ